MASVAQIAVAPNTQIVFEIAGSIPSYVPGSIFKDNLTKMLTAQGFFPDTVSVTTGYGVVSHDYKAIVSLTTRSAVLNIRDLIGRVASAAEDAGSWTPTVTVPAIGQPEQQGPSATVIDNVIDALGKVATGAGDIAAGAGKSAQALPTVAILLIIGAVVIVGFVALSPNTGAVARAVRP